MQAYSGRMKHETLSLREALLGGPGLDGYFYSADIYCVSCGRVATEAVYAAYPNGIPYPEAQDSETVPQPIFFGEADSAQHCAECGDYLYGSDDEEGAP